VRHAKPLSLALLVLGLISIYYSSTELQILMSIALLAIGAVVSLIPKEVK